MAFIGGAALAGIAALVVLKGGVNPSLANLATSPVLPPPAVQSANTLPGQLPAASQDVTSYLARQQTENDRMKEQMERSRTEIEQLKVQMQNQQFTIDTLNAQLKANAATPTPAVAATTVQQPLNPMLSGVLWAAGGIVLTVGGSIIIAGVFALASQQRTPRTVQVIHPIDNTPSPPLPTLRRSEFLPPRLEGRRVDHIDYDR